MDYLHPDSDTCGDTSGGDSKVGPGRKVEPPEKSPGAEASGHLALQKDDG